ncbi:MAG: hypothetical protein RLN88_07630 [Ekhidna sp.]|uniref:hypothetical protein n=1 Tax=Ekhidna sp. TaxID=2608089 RepID=UPI0032EBB777
MNKIHLVIILFTVSSSLFSQQKSDFLDEFLTPVESKLVDRVFLVKVNKVSRYWEIVQYPYQFQNNSKGLYYKDFLVKVEAVFKGQLDEKKGRWALVREFGEFGLSTGSIIVPEEELTTIQLNTYRYKFADFSDFPKYQLPTIIPVEEVTLMCSDGNVGICQIVIESQNAVLPYFMTIYHDKLIPAKHLLDYSRLYTASPRYALSSKQDELETLAKELKIEKDFKLHNRSIIFPVFDMASSFYIQAILLNEDRIELSQKGGEYILVTEDIKKSAEVELIDESELWADCLFNNEVYRKGFIEKSNNQTIGINSQSFKLKKSITWIDPILSFRNFLKFIGILYFINIAYLLYRVNKSSSR